MKIPVKALWALVLSCAPALAFAQNGEGWEHTIGRHLPGNRSRHAHLIQVTKEQRIDLANCMTATKQVEQIVDQMARMGSQWGRGRVSYSRHDLTVFSHRKQALDAALIALTTAHEELRKNLDELHDRALDKRLQKLDRLRAKLDSGSSEIGRDLATARPGPWSMELSWDVYAVRKAANKWHAEHEQIARDLDLAM
jgi:hypothetical protein